MTVGILFAVLMTLSGVVGAATLSVTDASRQLGRINTTSCTGAWDFVHPVFKNEIKFGFNMNPDTWLFSSIMEDGDEILDENDPETSEVGVHVDGNIDFGIDFTCVDKSGKPVARAEYFTELLLPDTLINLELRALKLYKIPGIPQDAVTARVWQQGQWLYTWCSNEICYGEVNPLIPGDVYVDYTTVKGGVSYFWVSVDEILQAQAAHISVHLQDGVKNLDVKPGEMFFAAGEVLAGCEQLYPVEGEPETDGVSCPEGSVPAQSWTFDAANYGGTITVTGSYYFDSGRDWAVYQQTIVGGPLKEVASQVLSFKDSYENDETIMTLSLPSGMVGTIHFVFIGKTGDEPSDDEGFKLDIELSLNAGGKE